MNLSVRNKTKTAPLRGLQLMYAVNLCEKGICSPNVAPVFSYLCSIKRL